MTNYFGAHLSVILLFISLAASQLRNEDQNNPLVSAETVSSLEYIHYSIYSHNHLSTHIYANHNHAWLWFA